MAVVAAASDTAINELAIVLEVDSKNGFAALYAADFTDTPYHISMLFRCGQ